MSTAAITPTDYLPAQPKPTTGWRRFLSFVAARPRILVGGSVFLAIVIACFGSLPVTMNVDSGFSFERPDATRIRQSPRLDTIGTVFGTDINGRSVLARTLFGGTISLAVGLAAASIAVFIGVTVGLIAGFRGGWVDSLLMRVVDVLYGLPYILTILLFKIALEPALRNLLSQSTASLVVMFLAIGLVSWLTMARVVRGQVLSIRSMPFIEAARAVGLPEQRIFLRHILPQLVGPITVYATLTIPQAILQESFLSFLGVGVDPTLPTWGSLASETRLAALNVINPQWWMLLFPCILLALTLLSLNFLGDGLRDLFDPKREGAKL
jgi:oligopeptide transport system permease protein